MKIFDKFKNWLAMNKPYKIQIGEKSLIAFYMNDNNMKECKISDRIIFDQSDATIENGGIYLIKINGFYKVRKLSIIKMMSICKKEFDAIEISKTNCDVNSQSNKVKIKDISILGKLYQVPEPFESNFEDGEIYELTKTYAGENYSFKLQKSVHSNYEQIDIFCGSNKPYSYFFYRTSTFCCLSYDINNTNAKAKKSDGFLIYIPDGYMGIKIASLILYELHCYRATSCEKLDLSPLDITKDWKGDDNDNRKQKLYKRFGYKLENNSNKEIFKGTYDSNIKIIINDPLFGFNIE